MNDEKFYIKRRKNPELTSSNQNQIIILEDLEERKNPLEETSYIPTDAQLQNSSLPLINKNPHTNYLQTFVPDDGYSISKKQKFNKISFSTMQNSLISKIRDMYFAHKEDIIILSLLTLASIFTRLYKIGIRDQVTWDEAHFGKFGAYYINRTFYHDVHPPLAKMLVALAEVIAGHNGTFKFDSGATYPSYVNYTFMRAQIAFYGIYLVPLAYITCKSLYVSKRMSILAALFILFDNALCVISKFILLDQPLLFFTSLSIMCFAQFNRYRRFAFSDGWWIWLTLTGMSLGFVVSSKWIGLFCVATIGLATIEHLWEMFGQLRMPTDIYLNHWAARIICLIFTPLVIYFITFYIHFSILSRDGDGSAVMTSKYQAKLIGHPMNIQPLDLAHNSTGKLRSLYPSSGLLHSHNHTFQSSTEFQATTFQGKDFNNDWNILLNADLSKNVHDDKKKFVDGDVIQFIHKNSSRVLRAVYADAPITKKDYMVSTYPKSPGENLGNADMWIINVYDQKRSFKDKGIHPLTTKFTLKNMNLGCYLKAGTKKLPKWGWFQNELTCVKYSGKKMGKELLWQVEQHKNPNLEDSDMSKYISTFFLFDFVQLNVAMGRSNNALVPDPDKYSQLESSPEMWPFLYKPMRMVGWDDKDIKYYEIGNPILWWFSSLACFLFPIQYIILTAVGKRNQSMKKGTIPSATYSSYQNHLQKIEIRGNQKEYFTESAMKQYWIGAKLLWSGWFFHYAPFFLMGRVTYLHHYLPALYFALLFLAHQLDYLFRYSFSQKTQNRLFIFIAVISGLVFWYFFPFTVGYGKPAKDLAGRVWRKYWNVYEDVFVIS
ncbi:hypothetical protein BB558_005705 [Smittium angustum]|uniref:Dolichyl-phosphate-mannose--protein mannosyltransferase n=1 Tax=Smittium angustum TaxID=133377 RepID=A0A2U1IUS6_SMIAN|nr:hypothetical protein BB558_007528 [Smittium angustum]PVZ98280.1 hypothetical protein BB558_005705 [Smittium angustum]